MEGMVDEYWSFRHGRGEDCTDQELPPMPMMLSGEQVSPTRPVIGPRTIPSNPARAPTAELLADCTLLQHWIDPVLHWLIGVAVEVAVTVTVVGTSFVVVLGFGGGGGGARG